MHVMTDPTDSIAGALIDSINQAKAKLNDCRCGAAVDQFRVVFPESADQFSAVCLGCQKGSAFVHADDYDHPIVIMKMARHLNRAREALGFMVEQWNEYQGPFLDPSRVIKMSDVLPHPYHDDYDD